MSKLYWKNVCNAKILIHKAKNSTSNLCGEYSCLGVPPEAIRFNTSDKDFPKVIEKYMIFFGLLFKGRALPLIFDIPLRLDSSWKTRGRLFVFVCQTGYKQQNRFWEERQAPRPGHTPGQGPQQAIVLLPLSLLTASVFFLVLIHFSNQLKGREQELFR